MASLSQAAESGDTVELLMVMRNSLIEAIEDVDTNARDLAPLTKRLQDVMRDLVVIKPEMAADQLALLKRCRTELASAIALGPPPRELAPLTRRLQDIFKEISVLEERSLEGVRNDDSGSADASGDDTFSIEDL